MTPHMEALAYRIWAYANPREWDCSYAEIADGTGISIGMVSQVITQKNWGGRVPNHTNITSAHKWQHMHGQNVDPNLLAVDQLML